MDQPVRRAGGKVLDRSLLNHGAVLEHRDAIGHTKGEFDIVRDKQHTVALVGERAKVIHGAHGKL